MSSRPCKGTNTQEHQDRNTPLIGVHVLPAGASSASPTLCLHRPFCPYSRRNPTYTLRFHPYLVILANPHSQKNTSPNPHALSVRGVAATARRYTTFFASKHPRRFAVRRHLRARVRDGHGRHNAAVAPAGHQHGRGGRRVSTILSQRPVRSRVRGLL